MKELLTSLREFNFLSLVVRLSLAAAIGALIGFGRTRQKRTAGIRTYMLMTIGTALTVLLAMYDYEMMNSGWSKAVDIVGMKLDVSRYSSGVISGMGFLAVGAILTVAHRQKEGLTTATGLFSCVCTGLACGAGFYEGAVIATVLIVLTLDFMPQEEREFKRNLRYITVFVEYTSMEDVSKITLAIEKRKGIIQELDIEREQPKKTKHPGAIFTIKMDREYASHSGMLSAIAKLPCVISVQELIS